MPDLEFRGEPPTAGREGDRPSRSVEKLSHQRACAGDLGELRWVRGIAISQQVQKAIADVLALPSRGHATEALQEELSQDSFVRDVLVPAPVGVDVLKSHRIDERPGVAFGIDNARPSQRSVEI